MDLVALKDDLETRSYEDFVIHLQGVLNFAASDSTKTSTDSNDQQEQNDIIEKMMTAKNEDGLNFLEKCIFILFEFNDDRFLFHVLKEVPNISKYLYVTNEKGWLPIFRILHLFR